MPELLLEILSEEIPARMQARAAEDLKRLVTEKLKEAGLAFTRADAFVTPRRLALVVDGLPERQPDTVEEKKGPRVDAPPQAIQGFLKAAGLTSVDECEVREVGKAKTYFSVRPVAGSPTERVLADDVIPPAMDDLPWPKSMRWAKNDASWVRPIHSILVVFAGEVIALDYQLVRTVEALANPKPGSRLEATNSTVGHRFLAPSKFTVKNLADYQAKLRVAKVILDPAERREKIKREASERAAQEGLKLRDDPGLLDEVTGLVEWPVALMGSIDAAFMALPREVLTASMRAHQKYFSLLKADGALAPRFVVIANTEADDGGKAIVAGNERVLRARLSDAKFFWDQDRKVRLADRVPALGKIVFHAKLDSVGDKVRRIAALASELSAFIPGADREAVRRAAFLAKADLTTGMVGEFPELQGLMGRYYALADGEKKDVAEAIAEHYAPRGPDDRCPTAPVSVAVSLADKLDTLFWFFAIGETPTGSKDPFALRRAALGIIRLIIENKLRIPLDKALEFARRLHPPGDLSRHATPERSLRIQERITALMDFFADRLKVHLREKGVRHDLVSAVFALGGEDDLVRLLARVDALAKFIGSEDGSNLLTAYKRAANIVAIEEKKDKVTHDGIVEPAKLAQDEEKALHAALAEARRGFDAALKREDFGGAMTAAAALRKPVDAFFDKVTVNAEDKALRVNRLRLLSEIRATLNRVADFSRIEG